MKQAFTISKLFISIFFISSLNNLHAQNLVPNFSFEVMDTCPLVSQITLAHPWNSPTSGTPDLFNSSCASQNLTAHTGIGSSGVYLLNTFPDNREYLQALLNSPLVEGQTYCVSFWVKRVNYRFASNRIGAYFSPTEISINYFTSNLPNIPQVDNPSSNMLPSSNWGEVSGSFVAGGGESYIIIGSFATDAETETVVANSGSSSEVSFYAIDDVSVTQCISGIDNQQALNEVNAFPTPATDYLNVHLPASLAVQTMTLRNTSGMEMQDISVYKNGLDDFVLNVQSLAPGIYLLTLQTNEGIISRKVLVAK